MRRVCQVRCAFAETRRDWEFETNGGIGERESRSVRAVDILLIKVQLSWCET